MSKRKKCYAVSVGHTPGIYDTWYERLQIVVISSLHPLQFWLDVLRREECKAQVDGFSGAKYKGFSTQAEALQFLE
jgi:viroplasmin and RNaseH domain-containing protein